jgi:type II secretory pathway pseudopilin PulG
MRPTPMHMSEAFTLLELMVVIVVVFVLLAMLASILVPISNPRQSAPRIHCINNLKEIGTAYRLWANDHRDRFPAMQSVDNGGWRELLTNADQGFMCWTNYAIMANYGLGNDGKTLVCPADNRKPVNSLSNLVSNTNLSYFVGASANPDQPQWFLAGDRNLCGRIKPDRNYGYSPESGNGNDVAIQTNSSAGPVCWSLKIHSRGNSAGAGNILLADGSGQQVTSGSLRSYWQTNGGLTTNWPAGHVPSSPSFRVLFP